MPPSGWHDINNTGFMKMAAPIKYSPSSFQISKPSPIFENFYHAWKDLAILYAGLFLFFGFLKDCSQNSLSEADGEHMKAQYLLEYGKPPSQWPVTIGLKEECDIFSIPQENSVATNNLNNAITLLRFNENKIGYNVLRRAFIDGVGSGEKCYPGIFSDTWTGYTQTNRFLLFNLEDKSFADHCIIKTNDGMLTNVGTFNGEALQFLFQVAGSEGKKFLRIIEFDGKGGFRQISELKAGPLESGNIEPWVLQNQTIFVYDNDKSKATAYDINFTPVQHPLSDLINGLRNFRGFSQIAVHPSLPLAVAVGIKKAGQGESKVLLARWNHPDPGRRFMELPGLNASIVSRNPGAGAHDYSDFQFSPDGKWLVFRDNTEALSQHVPNPVFLAMRIGSGREISLGKPRILGKVMRENARPTSTAWITKPLSFVVCDRQIVYKWDLEKLN